MSMMQCKSFFLKERTLKGLPGTLLVIMVLMLNVNCKCQKLFTSPINVLFSDQLTQFLCVFFSRLTITQMLQLCDFAGGSTSLAERSHVHDAYCCTNLVKEGSSEAPPPPVIWNIVQFIMHTFIFPGTQVQIKNRADVLVASNTPISPLTSPTSGNSIPLPNLQPLNFAVSIPKQHFYHSESIYRT